MWESQATLRGQQASPYFPPSAVPSQSAVLTNPFPQQGFVATQPPEGQAATQPLPSSTSDYQILMMNSDRPPTIDINLQTRSRQYNKPPTTSVPEPPPSVSTEPLSTPNGPLQIPQPKVEVCTKIPKGPLRRNVSSRKAIHSYSIIDDLAQSPTAISMLEILQSCPSQQKYLLSAMGTCWLEGS